MPKSIGVLVRGGLGNQMFQVAYGLMLAQHYGCAVEFIDYSQDARVKRDWGLSVFQIPPKALSRGLWTFIRYSVMAARRLETWGTALPGIHLEPIGGAAVAMPFRAPRLVDGYWQHAVYYTDILPILRRRFAVDLGRYTTQLQQIRLKARPIVALHARRGDYITDPAAQEFQVCDVAYYRRAWEKLSQHLNNPILWVFSDDIDWARENLAFESDVQFADGESGQPAWVDMMRMAQCDHFIISNSSYSWWAAVLASSPDKQVIAPRCWRVGVPTHELGICPVEWHLM